MTTRFFQILGLLCAGLLVAACDQGRKNPPDTAVRVVNAVPSYEGIEFRREQTDRQYDPLALTYQAASGTPFVYDVDQYDFWVQTGTAGSSTPITRTFSQQLREDAHYFFVMTEVAGAIEPVVLEYSPLGSSATDTQAFAMHAAVGFPAMSVYITPPGTDPAAVSPRGTLAFGEALDPFQLAVGEYAITLTESGNPANVLLESPPFTLPVAATTLLVITSGADVGPAPLAVIYAGNGTSVFVDKDTPAAVRALNGATDTAPRDFAFNGQFTPPLFPAVPFAELTDYATLPAGNNTLNVTPAGNTGVLELTQTLSLAQNTKSTLLVTGDAGALGHLLVTDDTRRLAGTAKLRLMSVARQFASVDFVMATTGTDLTTVAPLLSLVSPGASTILTLAPGTYDLAVRNSGSSSVLAGPQTITVAEEGIYSVLAVDGPDTSSVGLVLLGDF